ncbi:MAG: ABC transporter permease subunit [Candidatus Bathyarchaeota archaeon]|nr:ABC transporter permease subunit [Candidatus Bathyarchaeota archaeon]MDW8040060.1 ABC transporter permease subunit [Nitrososphaerota archaeon]
MDALQQLALILNGVTSTITVSIVSFFIGIFVGLPLSFLRVYGTKSAQILIDAFEKFFRGVPELVLLLMFYFGVGLYFPFPFKNVFFTANFVLGLRSAANQSQIFRGAIRGIGDEQMMAAMSLGLSKVKSVLYVMLPQVIIYSTPGLGSEYALLIKDSSYAYLIGVVDIMAYAVWIRKATMDTFTPYVISAFLYILLTFPIATFLDRWGSRKKKQLGLERR